MTTHDIREKYNMSQKDFAEYFRIPVATVRNWDSRSSMPDYVHGMAIWCLDLQKQLEAVMNQLKEMPLEPVFVGDNAKDVNVDGEWWDKYSEAPDLYRDPYEEDCEKEERKMKAGDIVYTPRFCSVRIEKVFDSWEEAYAAGYKEPTHYHEEDNPEYGVMGKSLDMYHMEFAGYRRKRRNG